MNTSLQWLPRPTYQERLKQIRNYLHTPRQQSPIRFSEFLNADNILFFNSRVTRIQVVEALVGTFPSRDQTAMLQSIWNREREGSLQITPDVAILRGRLEGLHHIRAAIGLCQSPVSNPAIPDSQSRVFVVFIGPTTQTHLHANLLVAISSLFNQRHLVEQLLKLTAPTDVLQVFRQRDIPQPHISPLKHVAKQLSDFLRIHYGWGPSDPA